MNNQNVETYLVYPEDYIESIENEKDFYVQFYILDNQSEAFFLKVIRRYLARHDILFLKDVIVTILKELITNATKANLKRLYFNMKNLDINDINDYRSGMETFKEEALIPDSETIERVKETKLVVRVLFHSIDGQHYIKVINNIPIIEEEISKVNARIKKAYKYSDITEAFGDVLDDSEGAGLGLIMAIMVFKNAGFSPDDFKLFEKSGKTVASLAVSRRIQKKEVKYQIAEEIKKEIEELPTFPENISKITTMCDDPESEIHQIGEFIKKDPVLTTNLLKLANSAGFFTTNKVKTIDDAIKIIGLNGLKSILTATGVQGVIEKKYKDFKKLWLNSYKKAFYAQKIAVKMKCHDISETAYLAALLSEIGKIALLSVKNEVLLKLIKISGIKEVANLDMLEEMTIGVSHTTIGSLICKKWNFDEELINSIELYLKPYIAPEEIKEIVYVVHLSHVYTEIERKKYRFEIVDDNILNFFNLTEKEEFDKLHKILIDSYESSVEMK